MIRYKVDVLETLKEAGYTTYRLRKDKLIGESSIQQLREGRLVSWANIDTICNLLNYQPGDLLIYENGTMDERKNSHYVLDGEEVQPPVNWHKEKEEG